ncbi:MAG: hypothetical protein ABJA50_13310, partial [Chloroflexota bacterium]
MKRTWILGIAVIIVMGLLGGYLGSGQARAAGQRVGNGIGPVDASAAPAIGPAKRSLGDLLNPDGTMNLNTGFSGTLDPRGW